MRNSKPHKLHPFIVCMVGIFMLFQSCNTTDEFYQDLQGTLQFAGGEYAYGTTYKVGDTIDFYGRFGNSLNNNLQIQIGNVQGEPVSRTYVNEPEEQGDITYDTKLQLVKVPVVESMGIGPNRNIIFTLDGQSINGSPIYIRDQGTVSVFSDTLYIKPTGFDFNGDVEATYFIKSQNGSGRVFYFDYETDTSLNVWENGETAQVPVSFSDETGNFEITRVYSAHVDRTEKHLFFCASTINENDGSTVQRLCKINLLTRELTTLNKTISMDEGPWEGNVEEVKLPVMYHMWVAESGKLYFSTSPIPRFALRFATGKIDADGQVSYIAGMLAGTSISLPQITFSTPPGNTTVFPGFGLMIDPDKGFLYYSGYAEQFSTQQRCITSVYDLEQQMEIGSFKPENAEHAVENVLDAPFEAAKFDMGGTAFLWGDKLVFFNSVNNSANEKPQAVVVDFENRETYTYAPYYISERHILMEKRTVLNYTPEGHVIFRSQYDFNDEPDLYPLYTLEVTEIK